MFLGCSWNHKITESVNGVSWKGPPAMARDNFHCPWTLPGMRFSDGSGMPGGDGQDAAKGARAAPASSPTSPAQILLSVPGTHSPAQLPGECLKSPHPCKSLTWMSRAGWKNHMVTSPSVQRGATSRSQQRVPQPSTPCLSGSIGILGERSCGWNPHVLERCRDLNIY